MPVYDAADHLRESLDSIVAQSYGNLDILVLDDGSSDESPAIARSYGEAIGVHARDENVGQFANVWDGIRRADGDYICVFHADDVYHPEIVEREARFLDDHPEVGAVFCLDVFIDGEGREYGRCSLPPDIEPRRPLHLGELLRGLLTHGNRFLRTPGAMVRADLYREVEPFRDGEFGHAADLDMWLRIARHAPVAVLDEHLFRYRHRAGSADRSYRSRRREVDVFFRLLDRHLAETDVEPPAEALDAFDARREEDRLLLAADDYVREEPTRMRSRLEAVDLGRLMASGRVQRPRLLVLYAGLRVLSRLPRIGMVARAFRRRWHPVVGPGGSNGAGAAAP